MISKTTLIDDLSLAGQTAFTVFVKRVCLFGLILATLLLYLSELKMLLGAALPYEVLDYIPDEFSFYRDASHYTLSMGMHLGYGLAFWGLSAGLIKLLPFGFASNLILLRAFFLLLKYSAFILVALAVKKLRGSFVAGTFYLTLLLTPAYYFYGKVFSTEYLLLFLTAFTVYLLIKDGQRLSSFFLAALAVGITAIMTKIAIAPLGFIFIGYLLQQRRKITSSLIAKASFIILLTLLVNALPLFNKAGWSSTVQTLGSAATHYTSSLDNLRLWFVTDARTWDQIPLGGINIDFTPVLISTFIFLFFYFFYSIQFKTILLSNKHKENTYMSFLLLSTGLIMATFICFQTTLLYWYLFPAYLLTMAGLFCLFGNRFSIGLILLILPFYTVHRISWRIEDRNNHNHSIANNAKLSQKISDLILAKAPAGGLVLTDINVAYHPTKPLSVLPLAWAIPSHNEPPPAAVRFIIINHQLNSSPLLTLAFNGKMPNNYALLGEINQLTIYKKI